MRSTNAVAPTILRLQPEADDRQVELIGHLQGPVLGIAGPGAGKTLAIVRRSANLLMLGAVQPRNLLLCTYSQAAARELRRRFDATVSAVGYEGDASQVRITTLHGFCAQQLRRRGKRIGLRAQFRVLSEDERMGLLARHLNEVFGPDLGRLERRGWRRPDAVVRNAARYFDRICDELIDPRELIDSGRRFTAALGRSYRRYEDLLLNQSAADFGHLQRWLVELLEDDEEIAAQISDGIVHLLCDEYQDTSHVQERLLTRVSQTHGNLCVVGDEDQALYRFRGASVENILNFPQRFPDCRVVSLTFNHRSHGAIVRAYDRWMASADWSNPNPDLPSFRHEKTITPRRSEDDDYPALISIEGRSPGDEEDQLVDLLRFLKRNRVIGDYSQVALLLHSVRDEVAGRYMDALDYGDIPAAFPRRGSTANVTGRRRGPGEVVVTTIHRAKGLEWDVVVAGSLDFNNRDVDPVGRVLLPCARRRPLEPDDRIAGFDHMRQHYVAFSRARRLLILSSGEPPRARFDPIRRMARPWADITGRELRALARQRFRTGPAEAPRDPHRVQPPPPGRVSGLRAKRIVVRMGPRSGQGAPPHVTRA